MRTRVSIDGVVRERLWRRVENEDELLDLEGYDVEFLWVHTRLCWISVAVAGNSMGGAKRWTIVSMGEYAAWMANSFSIALNKCNIEGVSSEPP